MGFIINTSKLLKTNQETEFLNMMMVNINTLLVTIPAYRVKQIQVNIIFSSVHLLSYYFWGSSAQQLKYSSTSIIQIPVSQLNHKSFQMS